MKGCSLARKIMYAYLKFCIKQAKTKTSSMLRRFTFPRGRNRLCTRITGNVFWKDSSLLHPKIQRIELKTRLKDFHLKTEPSRCSTQSDRRKKCFLSSAAEAFRGRFSRDPVWLTLLLAAELCAFYVVLMLQRYRTQELQDWRSFHQDF